MGGACSRKRDQRVIEDGIRRGLSGRYCKSGSSKWLGTSSGLPVDGKQGNRKCPSLMELCIYRICEDVGKYNAFSLLPRDISQQILDELVCSQCLTKVSFEAFRDCALQDLDLSEYPGLKDNWMDVISSQGPSLLSLDLSGSDVTDSGLIHLKNCANLQALNLNYCEQISDHGLNYINGILSIPTNTKHPSPPKRENTHKEKLGETKEKKIVLSVLMLCVREFEKVVLLAYEIRVHHLPTKYERADTYRLLMQYLGNVKNFLGKNLPHWANCSNHMEHDTSNCPIC